MKPCRAGSSGWRSIWRRSAVSASTRRSSTARSGSSASWRRFICSADAGCSSREQNREALAELQKAVYLSPYEAEPHLLIGRIYLRTGRPREAIDALRVSIWSQETAEARVALGQALLDTGDPDAARTEAQRALQLDPASENAKSLLSKIDQAPKKE